jgi:hypothetical protein
VFKLDSVDSLGNLGGIPPGQVAAWLSELDQKAKAGDFSGIHEHIQALQGRISGDVSLHEVSSIPSH